MGNENSNGQRKHHHNPHKTKLATHKSKSTPVPIPTSKKYPTAYIAFTSPASAALFPHKNASVSDWGNTPGEPTRYHAVRAKQASRWFCWAAMFCYYERLVFVGEEKREEGTRQT